MRTAIFISKESVIGVMADISSDPRLAEVKKNLDSKVLDFLRSNAVEIARQARLDTVSEVPIVPLFDKYMDNLEPQIKIELASLGYNNGTAKEIVDRYRGRFYRSALPNIMENVPK